MKDYNRILREYRGYKNAMRACLLVSVTFLLLAGYMFTHAKKVDTQIVKSQPMYLAGIKYTQTGQMVQNAVNGNQIQ